MLVLTCSTAVIDAVGYLGLDRVLTGNMTGNVVILGMALIGADNLPAVGPSIALAGFVLGAKIARRVLKPEAAGWSRRTTAMLTAVGITMATVAVVLFAHAPHAPHAGDPVTLIITGALAVAMGLQAATARHLSVKDVTVVVTSTLTGLAADSRLGGGTGARWGRRLGAVVLILAGTTAGAALLHVHACRLRCAVDGRAHPGGRRTGRDRPRPDTWFDRSRRTTTPRPSMTN
ncbi:YoaK family protein [Arthrobacter sp. RHLT1-20]